MGWADVELISHQFKLFDLVPESHILWGGSIYRSQNGKDNTRERVAEQEALGQPDYLELRVDFIRPNPFIKSQQEDKDKNIYLTFL